MVFHALTFKRDDSNALVFLITAPSVEIVDQWFRWTNEDGHIIERKSPEMYGYDYAKAWPWDKVNGNGKASQLKNKIMFKRIGNRDENIHQHTLINQFAPDHRSGKTFYIRSKSNPRVFWAEDNGYIFATKKNRVKFRITRVNSDGNDAGPSEVIIPEDKVRITAFVGDPVQECIVQIESTGALFTGTVENGGGGLVRRGHQFSPSSSAFSFANFKNGFMPIGKESEPNDAKVVSVLGGIGDEWELVS